MQALAERLADHLAPRTRAYHEIWLKDLETDEKELVASGGGEEVEPIYGPTYLPRKFKTGIGFTFDNYVDIYTHDLGLLAIVRDDKIIGYNVIVGGGQGQTPSVDKTFPALGKPMCFATPEQVVDVATAVVKVQRDFGNREDRKLARLKYLIHDWGIAEVQGQGRGVLRRPAARADRPMKSAAVNDCVGWHDQGDGKWFYGLNIENGRIKDDEQMQLKTALREVLRRVLARHPAHAAPEHPVHRHRIRRTRPSSRRSSRSTA